MPFHDWFQTLTKRSAVPGFTAPLRALLEEAWNAGYRECLESGDGERAWDGILEYLKGERGAA